MLSFDLMQGILQRTHIFGYSLPDLCCFLAAYLRKGRFSSQFSKGAHSFCDQASCCQSLSEDLQSLVPIHLPQMSVPYTTNHFHNVGTTVLGVGIRFSLRFLPTQCNLGFCVGHYNPLNPPSLGVCPGTSSGSPANPQGLHPTLDTPESPISHWRTL